MRLRCLLLLMLLLLRSHAQTTAPEALRFRVMSYNAENLFDCLDDSLKADEEFLPEAPRHWHRQRYWRKLDHVARVIAAVGEESMPALVGLCEVESDTVLTDLTRRSPLRRAGYRYLMTHSPDLRGINVALLYQPEHFRPLTPANLRIHGPRPTRDILYVSGLLPNRDTLDLFIVHLPSKLGGARSTLPFRLDAARLLKQAADSVARQRLHPHLLLMGDFNDTEQSQVLQFLTTDDSLRPLIQRQELPRQTPGSYQYKGRWQLIDHLLGSPTLFLPDARLRLQAAGVLALPFLLAPDPKHGGLRPHRTYQGYRYEGGYSDHLPLWAEFHLHF